MEKALRINSLGQETSTEEPEVSEESGTSFMFAHHMVCPEADNTHTDFNKVKSS